MEAHKCQSYTCKSCGELHSLESGAPHYCSVRIPDLKELGIKKSYCEQYGIEYFPKHTQLENPQEMSNPLEGKEISDIYPQIIDSSTQYFAIDAETYVCQKSGELVPYCLSLVKGCPLCAFTSKNILTKPK